MWFGVTILILCLGTRIGPTVVQDFSCRLLRCNSNKKWQTGLQLISLGIVGLLLVTLAATGARIKANRELAAERTAADRAEQKRLTEVANTERKRLIKEANAQVAAVVAEAETAWKANNLVLAQEKLDAASKISNANVLAPLCELQTRMANAMVQKMTDEAIQALSTGDIDAAKEKTKQALAVPHAESLSDTKKLARLIGIATGDSAHFRDALMELSDKAFGQLKENGTLPAQMLSGYEALDVRTAALAKKEVEQVAAARLARLEAERIRRQDAKRKAEAAFEKANAERDRKARANALASRKAAAGALQKNLSIWLRSTSSVLVDYDKSLEVYYVANQSKVSAMDDTSINLKRIILLVQESGIEYSRLTIYCKVKSFDKYGAENGYSTVFKLQYDPTVVKKIKPESITLEQLMNLANSKYFNK